MNDVVRMGQFGVLGLRVCEPVHWPNLGQSYAKPRGLSPVLISLSHEPGAFVHGL